MGKLTELEFGARALRITQEAASWSAEIMQMEDWRIKDVVPYDKFADPNAVFRFTDRIRRMIDNLDELAGRSALSDQEGKGV